MNVKEFKELTGDMPVDDDLERVNCKDAGKRGHRFCGICPKCKKPTFQGCHDIITHAGSYRKCINR